MGAVLYPRTLLKSTAFALLCALFWGQKQSSAISGSSLNMLSIPCFEWQGSWEVGRWCSRIPGSAVNIRLPGTSHLTSPGLLYSLRRQLMMSYRLLGGLNELWLKHNVKQCLSHSCCFLCMSTGTMHAVTRYFTVNVLLLGLYSPWEH